MLPTIVLPIWTDTVLHQTGKPAVRGFGARVYFYEREGADPIQVDGSITVYALTVRITPQRAPSLSGNM